MRNSFLALLLSLTLTNCFSQTDSTEVATDSIIIDSVEVVPDNIITNTSALKLLFEKLSLLEEQKAGKVNIVHIGDSHIQADLFSGTIRKMLQEHFGNAGSGFNFPHRLAKTNGSDYIRYSSNISWDSRRNIYPPEQGMQVGLSGIALVTKEDFIIEMTIRDTAYNFNTIKVITPGVTQDFDIATSSKTIVVESTVPKKISHKIKRGEVLGTIARKYGITVTQLKNANGLRTDNIRAGKTLSIPTQEMEKKEIKRSEFIPLPLAADTTENFYYHSVKRMDKIYLLPNKDAKQYNLNGIVLEKDSPGVIYHNIGVNGAKASDYNKYPLFFKQLPVLQPDMVVVSLGTNESFDKLTTEEYMVQLNIFIDNVRSACPDACILVMTPPPSLFKRKYPNTFVADYAKNILMQETVKHYASWDMFTELGGLFGVKRNAAKGLMSSDRVHYSVQGYQKQGEMFSEAFLKAYQNFKNNRD
ncbi:LysM peptidoglycan-binding domain-containing protein [Flavobacterium sp. MK4S-17]|uniref:LysM peptidoglycan-binding domain-containing protein n=1 Tax=Flavobacterium sp. MK4S-17 TaxID=2543737 RepID=UPI00135AEA27|nr:LysM peptidoglycan-binding domain-containing protein [Flavobacterium sp. MK4S-17]